MPRIIAGSLGGRTVPGPPGKDTRPTSDRVREALFSRLDGWDAIAGARVLDLYAGTGALTFEALSRGADSGLLVEVRSRTAAQLRRTVADLGLSERCEVRLGNAAKVATQLAARSDAARSDAVQAEAADAEGLAAGCGRFSLVFLDPPYDVTTETLESLLVTLRPALTADTLVVIERSGRSRPITWPAGWADDGVKAYGETVLQYGGPADSLASPHLPTTKGQP